MDTTTIIIIAAAALVVIFTWSLFNRLVRLKNQVKNAWAQIDVQLKRRADLIPNLVNTVKGYAKHEKELLENVTKARAQLMQATDVKEKSKANNMLTDTLKSLFAVAEAYPELKAQEGFTNLQGELSDTEDKVAYSRQFYNSVVRDFNQKIVVFPANMIAGMFGFKQEEFFEAEESEREAVKVDFGGEEKVEEK